MNMKGDEGKYSPDTLEAAIAFLKDSEKIHRELLKYAFFADEKAIYSADMIMQGMAQRSIKLTLGFVSMVEQSNAECAVPLLRLQLDNVMRFNALWLFNDNNKIFTAFLKDTFHKLKTSDGKRLTDAFLCDQISKKYEWFKRVYKSTSSYIHFSNPGLMSSVVGVGNDESRTISSCVGSEAGRQWQTEEKKEAVDAFIAATEILLTLFYSWGYTKETVARQRQNSENEGG